MDSVAAVAGEKRFSSRFITGSAANATSMPKNSCTAACQIRSRAQKAAASAAPVHRTRMRR